MKFFVSWGASINEYTEAELGHQMSFASTSLSTVSSTLSQIWHQVPCHPCSTPTKGPAWAELGLKRGPLQAWYGYSRCSEAPRQWRCCQTEQWIDLHLRKYPTETSPVAEATRSQTVPCKYGENDSWTQRILSVT